jgi:hypothetical protein
MYLATTQVMDSKPKPEGVTIVSKADILIVDYCRYRAGFTKVRKAKMKATLSERKQAKKLRGDHKTLVAELIASDKVSNFKKVIAQRKKIRNKAEELAVSEATLQTIRSPYNEELKPIRSAINVFNNVIFPAHAKAVTGEEVSPLTEVDEEILRVIEEAKPKKKDK